MVRVRFRGGDDKTDSRLAIFCGLWDLFGDVMIFLCEASNHCDPKFLGIFQLNPIASFRMGRMYHGPNVDLCT